MSGKQRIVFRLKDVPYIQSPDGTMRDSVMITDETCGSQQYTAGLFFIRPGTTGHSDNHGDREELYYVFEGGATLVIEGEPHELRVGDVAFIPAGTDHYLVNEGEETFGVFWVLSRKWSELTEIQEELATWPVVELGSDWGPAISGVQEDLA